MSSITYNVAFTAHHVNFNEDRLVLSAADMQLRVFQDVGLPHVHTTYISHHSKQFWKKNALPISKPSINKPTLRSANFRSNTQS